MQLQRLIPAATLCLVASCMSAACQGQPAAPAASYSVSVDGDGNRVVPHATESEALFDVRSETGIGSADVKQTSGEPPARIVIRLHLNGLEEFDFEYGETVVTVSVSSHGDQLVTERIRTAGSGEAPIGAESPYSMPVRVVAGPGSKDGGSTAYFEVQAPEDYIQGGGGPFTIRWIDFYR
jgi:hypothetical protein